MKEVLIYTTRFCPFCIQAKSLLSKKGIVFTEIPVDNNSSLRQEMVEKSGRHTVPQIWVGDAHIGGCDELYELDYKNQLDGLLS